MLFAPALLPSPPLILSQQPPLSNLFLLFLNLPSLETKKSIYFSNFLFFLASTQFRSLFQQLLKYTHFHNHQIHHRYWTTFMRTLIWMEPKTRTQCRIPNLPCTPLKSLFCFLIVNQCNESFTRLHHKA